MVRLSFKSNIAFRNLMFFLCSSDEDDDDLDDLDEDDDSCEEDEEDDHERRGRVNIREVAQHQQLQVCSQSIKHTRKRILKKKGP